MKDITQIQFKIKEVKNRIEKKNNRSIKKYIVYNKL
jgi:hypothetical protein